MSANADLFPGSLRVQRQQRRDVYLLSQLSTVIECIYTASPP